MASNRSPPPVPADIRRHVLTLANDGILAPNTWPEDVAAVFDAARTSFAGGAPARIILYAHGGLVPEKDGLDGTRLILEKVARPANAHLVSFVWKTGFSETTGYERDDRERAMATLGWGPMEEVADWWDEKVETLIRNLNGDKIPGWHGFHGDTWWRQMKQNASRAWAPGHGGDLVLKGLVALKETYPDLEVHLVGHSAGSIFFAPFIQGWTALGNTIDTCTLWAPACTMTLFHEAYAPSLGNGSPGPLRHLRVYTLTKEAELNDDCFKLYRKSLLHLISKAFEGSETPVPLLGMAEHLERDAAARGLVDEWILAPGSAASAAQSHGGFNDDGATLASTSTLIGAARKGG